MSSLSPQLKEIMSQSVEIFGSVIKLKLGVEKFNQIESLRKSMTSWRGNKTKDLSVEFSSLMEKTPQEQIEVAKAFALMLELMNSVEMSFRRFLNQSSKTKVYPQRPEAVVLVLTAHPTEARHPENIRIFTEISDLIVKAFQRGYSPDLTKQLFSKIDQAWEAPLVRTKKPKVEDESRLIHDLVFREEIIDQILESSHEQVPIYLRSWVGGDKDGHPGVNDVVMENCLNISRQNVVKTFNRYLTQLSSETTGIKEIRAIRFFLKKAQKVSGQDYKYIESIKKLVQSISKQVDHKKGYEVPTLSKIKRLIHIFPALVISLEFRESSEVINELKPSDNLALMIKKLKTLSKNQNPKFYVRGLIVSMTKSSQDLINASLVVKKYLGSMSIPVVPLFEQKEDLEQCLEIMTEYLTNQEIKQSIKKMNNQQEVMLGYSDSAKQCGVLNSRLLIQSTMVKLEELFESKQIRPIFFHGSGGSADRGGGAVLDQTKSWTKGALNFYKVTIQGEMVERQFASAEIFKAQVDKILQAYNSHVPQEVNQSLALLNLVEKSAENYIAELNNPSFLNLIDKATPYNYLNQLKFGSRPTKRAKQLSVKSLRAIPWILCWTQTRILFPFWFGVGSAWATLSSEEKKTIQREVTKNPALLTYFRVLNHTLDKVQPQIFNLYTKELSEKEDRFSLELKQVQEMMKFLQIENTKPWLSESIYLRSPMIHPLNLLQVIALKNHNYELFRYTVAGISFGMMATG